MTYALGREQLLDLLLSSLATERFSRAPLLSTILDELAASESLRSAFDAANGMLDRLTAGSLADADFVREVEAVRHLVHHPS